MCRFSQMIIDVHHTTWNGTYISLIFFAWIIMGWKTPPECLNTFAFIACSLKAGATLPWPSRRDEVRCYTHEKIGTWSLEQPIESKSHINIYIYMNQASKDTRHHFVTCWFDKIMFAGSNHLLILINSWLKLLTGIWFAGSGSQCALWSLWDCTHLRPTQRSHEPMLLGLVHGTTSGAQEHLPDSQFCRICGCQRDVLTSAFHGLTLVDSVLSKYVKNSGAYM